MEPVSSGRHACARLADGRVKRWGRGASGRLGAGNTDDHGDGELGGVPFLDLGSAL